MIKQITHSSEDMYEVKDESVHLIVTSPPYPMIQKWDELFGVVDFEEQHKQLDKTWQECVRVLMPGGICCINIGDATRKVDGNFQCFPNYSRIVMKMVELGLTPLIPIHWKKITNRPNAFLGSGMLPPNGYIAQDCEYIAIFRKGKLRKFKPKDENRYDSAFTKEERDQWFQQVWNIKGAKGAGKDSSFPAEIPNRLIQMFSVKKDVILDPFSGTGTTLFEAVRLYRNAIGYDVR